MTSLTCAIDELCELSMQKNIIMIWPALDDYSLSILYLHSWSSDWVWYIHCEINSDHPCSPSWIVILRRIADLMWTSLKDFHPSICCYLMNPGCAVNHQNEHTNCSEWPVWHGLLMNRVWDVFGNVAKYMGCDCMCTLRLLSLEKKP